MTKHRPQMLLSLLLALLMVATMLPMTALAADETTVADEHICTDKNCTHEHEETASDAAVYAVQADTSPEAAYSGTIGESAVTWRLDTTSGRLFIGGSCGCATFSSPDDQPWATVRGEITEVWYEDMEAISVENLAYWFTGCSSLTTAEVPYTTPIIGTSAFDDCPALKTLMLYFSDANFTITQGAFSSDTLRTLAVYYIAALDEPMSVLSSYDWSEDNRAAYFEDVYGTMLLASGYCVFCDTTCSYSVDYEPWTVSEHCVRHWCSNCGKDQCGGVNGAAHTFSNGVCTKCGYDNGTGGGGGGGEITTCYHNSTYTTWDGCYWTEYCSYCGEYINSGTSHSSTYTTWSGCTWYEYCNRCDELMDSGTSHGTYSYGAWEYYNTSRHRRYYSCNDCGEGAYDYGYHSTTTSYSPYNSTQHSVRSYCATCGSYIGSTSYANHSFAYGAWQSYSGSQHRRLKSCSVCGYSEYEYASHSLSTGAWSSISATQHRRTISCSTCGYSTTETASHSLTYGSWTNYSATQHRRSVNCVTCGYSSYEYDNHSLTYGAWSSVSETQHRRTVNCSCGYSTTETASHSLVYRDWTSISDTQHQRTVTCSGCSYSTTGTGNHSDADSDGYCDGCGYLMTRFSVTVPAILTMTVSKYGEVYTANNAVIANNSTGAVSVSTVSFTAQNGWTLVPYSNNMATTKVDAKQIGFSLNGFSTLNTGSYESLSTAWEIASGGSLPLIYDAVVSATSQAVSEQVLTVVFILDWAVK